MGGLAAVSYVLQVRTLQKLDQAVSTFRRFILGNVDRKDMDRVVGWSVDLN